MPEQFARAVRLLARLDEADLGKRPEAKHIFLPGEAVAEPEPPRLCPGSRNQQMQPESVGELVGLRLRLRVLDRELRANADILQFGRTSALNCTRTCTGGYVELRINKTAYGADLAKLCGM